MKIKNFEKGGHKMTEIEYIEQELEQLITRTLEMENEVMKLEN